MLDQYQEIFKTTYELAKKRRINYLKSIENRKSGSVESVIDFSDIDTEEDALTKDLRNYLMSLDFEAIKTIQIIMYLGRNKDYNKELSPEEIFLNEKSFFEEQGWKDKFIEVDQITQKMPLDDFLKSGLEILKVW